MEVCMVESVGKEYRYIPEHWRGPLTIHNCKSTQENVYGDLSWGIHIREDTLDDLLSLCVLARKTNPLFSPWFHETRRQTKKKLSAVYLHS
ncbi:hypothetical protein Pcinc_012102 [Petrolisthes cinctipes]|uniref:Uncharacterized protein n=1 Tax=Petrolisthes cinctipes TaxID=88211 RepID=A0AAE1KSW7_PETCI|nr:hypothetical protein Pcinc_012102 [Petrolisthes cinctipes]